MRYLELSLDFGPEAMFGAGIHVADLVRGLAANGDAALVATRASGGPARRELHDGRVTVLNPVAAHASGGPGGAVSPRDTAWFLADRLAYNHAVLAALDAEAADVDVVHNHEPVMVPLACELAEARRVPLVTTVHIPDVALAGSGVPRPRWIDRHVARALEVEGYRRSRLILAPSEATAALLRAEYPWCAERVRVLELPRPEAVAAKTSYRVEGPAKVLVVSRLDPNKGLLPLIAALGRLPAGSVECVVVGAGGLRAELLAAAERASVAVTLSGKLPRPTVLQLYADADVFVAPSPLETYGLSLQEAMTAGLPVVATDIPPFAERIADGDNGLLVPTVSGADGVGPRPERLAEAIGALLASESMRRRLGEAARGRFTPSITEYAAELGRLSELLI